MLNNLSWVIGVALVLGVMVLVHEWGHFIVAKMCGVRVDVFSIGFGPRLFGIKRGPTDYRLSALPIGGYVRMAGDNPLEDRKGEPDEFLSKPRWQRVLIALAGPTMNVITAVVILTGLFMNGRQQPAFLDRPIALAGVIPNSTAQHAGLMAGDKIVELNGFKDPTWDRAELELSASLPGSTIPIVVDRGGQQLSFEVPATTSLMASSDPASDAFGYPEDKVMIVQTVPGLPAEVGGLKAGDQIVSVDGIAVVNRVHFTELVQREAVHTLDLVIVRNGKQMHVEVRAQRQSLGGGRARWQIGADLVGETFEKRYSLPAALGYSLEMNSLFGRQIVTVVGDLFVGKVSLKQLEGPLGIAQESGRAVRSGPEETLLLMALIGMNLAILNLLPIPPLDGGHILLLAIEGSLRRDLSLRVKERFITVSMVFILLVFAIVMYNDVLRLLPHH